VAAYLNDPTHLFRLAVALPNNDSAHLLIAYQDAGTQTTHIADLALIANGGTTTFLAAMTEHVSDIVALTGVALTDLTAANLHFV